MTRFRSEPGSLKPLLSSLFDDVRAVLPAANPLKARVESGYVPFDKWGDGAATKEMLSYVNASPEIRAAVDNNPHISRAARDQLAWDERFAGSFGVTSEALQNARAIVGDGPGWVGRLETALKNGVVLPAVVAALLAPSLLQQAPAAPKPSGG
jgi:hypothetical protein